jgi:hypothetical protein
MVAASISVLKTALILAATSTFVVPSSGTVKMTAGTTVKPVRTCWGDVRLTKVPSPS